MALPSLFRRPYRSTNRARRSGLRTAARVRPWLEALEDRSAPAVFPVTTPADAGPGSLRQAILDANAAPGDDTIPIEVAGTINLAGALPPLSTNIDLQGPGASLFTVRRDTGGNYNIFTVPTGATVGISGLTIANGSVSGGNGGGIANAGTLTVAASVLSGNSAFAAFGGGIDNTGTLHVIASTIRGSYAGAGGGIANRGSGTVSVTDSTISDNTTNFDGGGILNRGGALSVISSVISGNSSFGGNAGGIESGGGPLTVTGSTISGNSSLGSGGGIRNGGTLRVTDSTISGNSAGSGGGSISNFATVTVTNSTLSGNSAGFGGAIANYSGTLTVTGSTVSGNSTTGVSGGIIQISGLITVRNTILARNTAGLSPPDIRGTLASQGHNLIGNPSGGSGFHKTDLLNVDPLLGPLQDNGGPTFTHALLPGSPALDAGDDTGAPEFDQRGLPRIVADAIDIGAFEVQIGLLASFAIIPDLTTVPAGTPVGFYVAALDAYGHVVTDYVGEVAFASSDPGAVLPVAYTFQVSDGGIAYFADGVTFAKPGPQELYVFDTATQEEFGYAVFEVLEP